MIFYLVVDTCYCNEYQEMVLSQEDVLVVCDYEKYMYFNLLTTFEVEKTIPSKCNWERDKALTAKIR